MKRVLVAFVLLPILLGYVCAQASAELDRLDEKLTRHFEKAMPNWKHERVEPISGSGDNVLVEFWSFSDRKVKVSVLLHNPWKKRKRLCRIMLNTRSIN